MNEYYKTRDLAEASALIVKGKHFIKMERESKICIFVFENKKECEILSNKFFFGSLSVDARSYYETITRLKNRIFAKD